MNQDIAAFAYFFHTMLNLNKWGVACLDFTCSNIQSKNLPFACFKIIISSLELPYFQFYFAGLSIVESA